MMKRSAVTLVLFVALLLGFGSSSYASVIFTLGNNPQSDEENIFLNSGVTGSTVYGITATSGLTLEFLSTTDLLVEPSSGQARVEASDGLVNNIRIAVPGGYYTDLIVNPFTGSGTGALSVVTTLGTHTFDYTLANGQNFLTIVATGGERILSTTINASDGFIDLRQPRISGAALNTTPVPEPASMLMLGSGLVGLAARFRSRRS